MPCYLDNIKKNQEQIWTVLGKHKQTVQTITEDRKRDVLSNINPRGNCTCTPNTYAAPARKLVGALTITNKRH